MDRELEGRNYQWPLSARYVGLLLEGMNEEFGVADYYGRINITFIAEQYWQVIE